MPSWLGRTLGKVTVEYLLARGGTAEVYLGRHATLQRAVAIKVLNNQYADNPELLDRFQREARVIAMLRHPNIVQVYDFDTIEGHPYLIMEYVPGTSLSAQMRAMHARHERLNLPLIDKLITPVAAALQYAHERGVIHRDIKPGNILLTSPSQPIEAEKDLPEDVQPVLTDFGLVRFLNSPEQTAAGQLAGTPAYMSPEQARGQLVDTRTDVYSLGVVLYELLAGHPPFEADTTMSVLMKHINEPPPAVPDLRVELQRTLDRALAKQPADRFQTPNEFAAAVDAAVRREAEASTVAESLPSVSSPLSEPGIPPTSGWNWLSTGFIAAAVLILAGFLGLRSWISGAQPQQATYPATAVATSSASMVEGQPIGVLRFQDGSALVDEVSMSATNMPRLAAGYQYEVWLIAETGEERRSIAHLPLDSDGNGKATFVDPQGRNLLAVYDKMEITLEPDPDPSPNPTNDIAFSSQLPPNGLLHVRHLLVSFSKAPGGVGLVDGLLKDATFVDDSSQRLLAAFQSGDEVATRLEAEVVLNLIVGSQSEDYKDWDGDGKISDLGDGYGLLLNGDNTGYIQGVFAHAGYAASAADATPNMILHGDHVKICAQNLEQWTPQLRDLAKQVLAMPFGPPMGAAIRQMAAASDNILKGIDLNGNERIEPIPGEGGAQTAYQHAYYMADIILTLQK